MQFFFFLVSSLTLGEWTLRLTICGLLVRLLAKEPFAGPGEMGEVGDPDTSCELLLTLGMDMRAVAADG